jgi:uroporphyrinogen-III synthase
MKIIITRPEEDAQPLAEKLKELGHSSVLLPLLKIVVREDVEIPLRNYQAICLTSANGVRLLQDISMLKNIPVIAVGTQSLQAATDKGFANVTAQGGDVIGLAAYIVQNFDKNSGPILYISGSETSGDLEGKLKASGFDVDRVITYDAVPASLRGRESEVTVADGVLLYSPRSAKLWLSEITALNLQNAAKGLNHICLSANVAAALPQSWHKSIANSPTESAILALLDCKRKAD